MSIYFFSSAEQPQSFAQPVFLADNDLMVVNVIQPRAAKKTAATIMY